MQSIIPLTNAHNSLDCGFCPSASPGYKPNWTIKKEWKWRTSQKCFSKRKPAILSLPEISEYNCENRYTITWISKKKKIIIMKKLLMELSQDKVKVTMKLCHETIAKDDPSPDSVLTDQGMVLQHWSRCSEAKLGAGYRAHPWP